MTIPRKEGTGVKAGSYVGTFNALMSVQNKPKQFVHDTKGGPMVRYTLKTSDGIEVPGSFPFDTSHYNYTNHLGAFGTPARAVSQYVNTMNPSQLLAKLEAKWKKLAIPLNAWIPEDGGWIAALKPNEGTFQVKFGKFLSREKETDKPIHVLEVKHGVNKKGQSYVSERDIFKSLLIVESGQNEGAAFILRLDYPLKEDESGRLFLDTRGSRGQESYSFFRMHGIDLEKLSTDKFADEKNLLPELEPLMIKADVSLIIEVENGWPTKITLAPTSGKVSVSLEKDASLKRNLKATEEASAYVGTLRLVINKVTTKNVFDRNGVMLETTKFWKLFVSKNRLPKKLIEEYTDKDVYVSLVKLGFRELAESIKE